MQPDYRPDNMDVLRARVRSTGIEEAEFQFADLSFKYESLFTVFLAFNFVVSLLFLLLLLLLLFVVVLL